MFCYSRSKASYRRENLGLTVKTFKIWVLLNLFSNCQNSDPLDVAGSHLHRLDFWNKNKELKTMLTPVVQKLVAITSTM